MSNDTKTAITYPSYEPSWDIYTKLLVTFNENLLAGNISSGDSSPTTWKLYRRLADEEKWELAAVTDNSTKAVVDYNIKNRNSYIYGLFAQTATYITAPIVTDAITPNWKYWCLFSVDETSVADRYSFHEGFLFEINLEVGAITNNMEVGKFANFTPYPKFHKSPSNHYSGSLTSLAGYADCTSNITYVEPLSITDKLKVFSTDSRRKFLKDIRGDIWEVEISSSLQLQIQKVKFGSVEPYEIQVNWTEIGTTDGLTITKDVAVS